MPLVIAAVIIALSVIPIDITPWAFSAHSPVYTRFSYHIFHASTVHALINAWCIISVCVMYRVKKSRLIPALIIAAIAPDFVISGHTAIVGLSAICFALIGIVLTENRRPLTSHIRVLFFIALGLPFSSVCVALHLYAFIGGIIYGLVFLCPCIKET